MKILVIASGSKGNCTYIELGNTRIIIDVGINYNNIKSSLDEMNIEPEMLSGVLITHTHSDHIKGLSALIKKSNTKVFVETALNDKLKTIIPINNIINVSDEFSINDVSIKLIHTSHDVPSVGYIIKYNGKEIVYITDTGYINKKYFPLLKNKEIYVIESNHDEKMLLDGPYPYELKKRIISDYGHLSNTTVSKYLCNFVGLKTKYIILAHISETNNTEEIAYQTLINALEEKNISIENIIIAKKYEETELVEI